MKGDASHFAYVTSEEVLSQLHVDPQRGLAPHEVAERLKRSGYNRLTRKTDWGLFGRVIAQFKNPLVFVLVAAAVITVLLHEYVDALVILAALTVNVSVGAFQENRASKAFERLNASQEHVARVLRGDKLYELPVEQLVPGDIVELHSGAYVPADLRLVHTKDLSINESALTGEWAAVSKSTQPLEGTVPLAEQSNMAWMGTLVTSGYGRGVVVQTGDGTQVGLIARELTDHDSRKTPLQESIQSLATFIVYIVLGALVVIFALGLLRGQPFAELFLLSIAVAVAAMPQGLPAVVTVVLALGMEAILRSGGLVRNLLAAETLGATTIILTDKTGTLTEAKMQLARLRTLESLQTNASSQTDDDRSLLEMAILASDAFIEEAGADVSAAVVRGRPLEQALVLAGLDLHISQRDVASVYPRIDFEQFESERRYGASLNRAGDANRLIVNGAPELLLQASTYVYFEGRRKRFTAELKEEFRQTFLALSGDGMRIIATAYKDVPWTNIAQAHEEKGKQALISGLTFMGLIAFSDPIRADVPASVRSVRGAGARVIMVTGDNPQTAQKIARDAGIGENDLVVYTGEDIENRNDDELYELLKTAHVFARTLPVQKLRLVRILKAHGEVVAMTGDGVNDAPALQNATIGVAVGSGTEVAKEASDIVLINNSFSIIVYAIEEGRRILDNLKKVIAYLLATSSSEIIVIGSALIIGAPVPLLPTQILWANMVEEGLMSFAFAFEPKEKGLMQRNPRSHAVRSVLTPQLKWLIVIVSAVTGVLLIGLYLTLLAVDVPIEKIRTIMFVALSLDAIFFTFSLKSLDKPLWKINPFSNRFLLVSLTVSILTLFAALILPPLQYLLSLTPLTLREGVLLLAVGLGNLITIEMVKFFVFERPNARMSSYGPDPDHPVSAPHPVART